MKNPIHEFEDALGLPKDFYAKLIDEDDWSFIIKMSALFEASTTNALSKTLSKNLEENFSFLEYARPRTGKIAFLKNMNIFNQEQSKFLISLAEIRNTIVHKIGNVNFSFEEYISSLNPKQKKNFITTYGIGLTGSKLMYQGKTVLLNDFILKNPKVTVWLSAREIFKSLYLTVHAKKLPEGNFLNDMSLTYPIVI
ncbi:hypothetical protein ACLHDG_06630 [Sulfurovum sp. CS9]|uniref:hypothetical protein n=1 Tax=Sulfurovum sp. CS9 TaxID=3391146 RepID=UPI0039E802D4